MIPHDQNDLGQVFEYVHHPSFLNHPLNIPDIQTYELAEKKFFTDNK
jgi:hypothetical protein